MSLYSLKSATLSILTLRWQPPACRGADFQTAKIGCCAAMRHAVVMAANAMYQAILTVISTESQECHDSFVASPQPAQEFSSPALLTTLSF
jgi:hypothetical protein